MKLVTQVPEKVGGEGETEGCLKEVKKKCLRKSILCMSILKNIDINKILLGWIY